MSVLEELEGEQGSEHMEPEPVHDNLHHQAHGLAAW